MRRHIDEREYKADRVPFELFQNADDATLELGPNEAGAHRVRVELDDGRLRLVHWGRSLNDVGPDREKGRRHRHDQDLQKLLMPGFSSKWFDERTTGRFGLGFKSVYLVTDYPLIVSRWLAVRIKGTLFPEAAPEAVELARSFGAERPATVIELPRRQNGPVPSDYAKSFRDSLGPLCVFAKAIRTISWNAGDEELESTWRPSSVSDIAGLEVGRLEPGTEGGAAQRVLVFRRTQKRCSFASAEWASSGRPIPFRPSGRSRRPASAGEAAIS
jgi:hypothetical protein